MSVPILRPVQRWHCPQCGREAVTHEARPHTEFHACPKLRGLKAPMLPAGTKGKLELREPDDYVGDGRRGLVQRDPERRRPVMSIVTTRDNGQDTTVFAPAATAVGD